MTNTPPEVPQDAPTATPTMEERIQAHWLLRRLGRVADAGQATLAAQYAARGYFPDAASAMLFLKQIDPRNPDYRFRNLFRVFRLKSQRPAQ